MIYIDECIMQKGKPVDIKILENFISPFDADVITKLEEPIQRVSLSEFGLVPKDTESCAALPAPLLCNDVFGYVRRQAAKQGLCYLRPTYGTVSRAGLIQTAASMDQIGIVARTPAEAFALFQKISAPNKPELPSPRRAKITPPYADVCDPVLHILAYAEISCNLSRYDGIKFGYRAQEYSDLESLYTNTRTEGFSIEAKLAAIMGYMVLSQDNYAKYYEKAARIRRLIKESMKFDEINIYELPVESHLAVLCGLPSLTINGVQLVSEAGNEELLCREAAQ